MNEIVNFEIKFLNSYFEVLANFNLKMMPIKLLILHLKFIIFVFDFSYFIL